LLGRTLGEMIREELIELHQRELKVLDRGALEALV